MRYLATVSYDGSKYYGFQRLNDLPSIQGELESILSKINKTSVLIKGSGRTDRGVHAKAQKFHFDLDVSIPPERLINAINSMTNPYLKVTDIKIVNDDFHARFNVKKKTYKYVINLGEYNPIYNDYMYNYCYSLNIDKMMEASKYLIGKHSFKSFVSGYRDNYNSEIYDIIFNVENDMLTITFVGKSFYRYMIRNMVGALIYVSRGKISITDFIDMINKGKEKTYLTVPANGLYLESVDY